MDLAKELDSIPVVQTATERDALFPVPKINQRVYRLDTRGLEMWTGVIWGLEGISYFVPGLVADGATLDATAIQNALNQSAANKTVVVIGAGKQCNIGTTTIAPPVGSSLIMEPGSLLLYSGTGVAVDIVGNTSDYTLPRPFRLRVEKSGRAWKTTDTTSIGVRLKNCSQYFDVVIEWAVGFWKGVQAIGDGAGTAASRFTLLHIFGNKIGLALDTANAGWTNQNEFVIGFIRLDSVDLNGASPYVGTRGIAVSATCNANIFTGPLDLEGGAVEETIEDHGAFNKYFAPRLEGALKVHFYTGSQGNVIEDGYNRYLDPDVAIFQDDTVPKLNFIQGSTRTGQSYGSVGNSIYQPAFRARCFTDALAGALDVFDTLDRLLCRLTHSGKLQAWKSTQLVNAAGIIDLSVNEWDTGDGTVAASKFLAPIDNARMGLHKGLVGGNAAGGYFASSAVALAAGATSLDLNTSNCFTTANTSATTINSFANGTSTGQWVFLACEDSGGTGTNSNTTLQHNPGVMELLGNRTRLLRVGETVCFFKFFGRLIEVGAQFSTPSLSADRGDTSPTLTTSGDAVTQIFNTPLTANRVVTLPNARLFNGQRYRVVRTAAATGAFTLAVQTPTATVLKTMPSATAAWSDYETDGTNWWLTGYAPL